MSYSRVTTFADGTAVSATQIKGNFKKLRDWEVEDIAVADVDVLSSDKIKKPEMVYASGNAQLVINSTGCIAKNHNPAVNFRRERPRNISLTYNGAVAHSLHAKLSITEFYAGYGREVPKTGVLFYMEEPGSVRITYNIMINAYYGSYDSADAENFLFIACYAHDNGEHDNPVYPYPDVYSRSTFPATQATIAGGTSAQVNGDNTAALRCITIHQCFNGGAGGSSMLAKGWYHASLFAAMTSRFGLVGANTAVVEAHYGVHVTVSDGVSI